MRGQIGKVIILTILILIPFGNIVEAQKTLNIPESKKPTQAIVRVKAINICMGMGTNRVYGKEN